MTGAIKKTDMSDIIQCLLREEPEMFSEDQVWEQINKRSKGKQQKAFTSSE